MKEKMITLRCLVLWLGASVSMVAMSHGATDENVRVPGPALAAVAEPATCDMRQAAGDVNPSDTSETTLPVEQKLLDLVRPLPPGVEVRKWGVGADGAAAASDDGASRLVYSNTLGNVVLGPAFENLRFADDIVTTGISGCLLDRYVIRVSGDARGDGSGVGPYAVDVALYETCPGAGDQPTPIPGTAAHVDLPDNGTYDVEIVTPAEVEIPIPSSFYLAVSFNRPHSGIVMGAPALLGFSADRFDYPGFACMAGLGGFPEAPHASVYAQIYVRGECEDSFVGYRNSNHAGNAFSAGSRVYFAQQIQLAVDQCDMVALEVVHKGNGFVRVDMCTFLIDDDPGLPIPSFTRLDCFSTGDEPQVCRGEFDPPIRLVTPDPWVVFKTNSPLVGPLLTCKQADLGTTENEYRYYMDGEWLYGGLGGPCWSGFDITVYCDGHPPLGACCDMVLTDDESEAVCRDGLAEMNCPFPTLWKEDASCGSVCLGGPNDGEACMRQADCPGGDCPGPFMHPCGVSACCEPDSQCENLTENQCNEITPVEAPRIYDRGEFCYEYGHWCPFPACVRREGNCCMPQPEYCVGGERDGETCDYWFVLPNDPCPGHSCVGGLLEGELCDPDDPQACPGGRCEPGVCVGEVGCNDPYCCTEVCSDPYNVFCCTTYWDGECASEAMRRCNCAEVYDECWSPDPRYGARLLTIPGTTEMDGVLATTSETDPGFCCHEEQPGAQGMGTLWYKFVAPPNGQCDGGDYHGRFCDPNAEDPENTTDGCPGGTCLPLPVSVHLDTCCSNSRPGAPADDSLLQVFAIADPDRGLCDDGLTVCSVAAQDCYAGSDCVFDEQWACANLMPIACSDDAGPSCVCGPTLKEHNSKLCVPGLNPGELYYVMIAAKSDENRGIWQLRVTSPCTPDLPPQHNDLCMNAEKITGVHLEVPFDLFGEAFGEAPATLDCPEPPGTPVCTSTMKVDLWYDWVAPDNGKATIHTCGYNEDGQPTDELTPDTSLVVYDGCECPVGMPMELREGVFACNDFQPSPCFLGSKLTDLIVEEGQCYKMRVGGIVDNPYNSILEGSLNIDFTHVNCPPGPVTFFDPPSGVVDARQPHPPGDPLDPQGVHTFLVEAPPGAALTWEECWSLCETLAEERWNYIADVIDNGDGTFTVHLARPITTGAVTTITYTDNVGGEHTGVFTSHPGNVNGDNRTSPSDILFLIDVLNGVRTAPWGEYSTDCDHSSATGPADILCIIDLLNGAGEFDPWLNRPLPWPDGCVP